MPNWCSNRVTVFGNEDEVSKVKDIFATMTVVDDEKRFVTGQNQNSGHETAYAMMEILNSQ